MSLKRRFNFDGVVVDVQVQSPGLAQVVEGLLAGCAVAEDPEPGAVDRSPIVVSVAVGSPPQAPAGPSKFSFPPMRAFAREGGWLLLEDVGFLEVSPAAGVIRGAIQPGLDLRTCVRFATVSFWVALLECLRARGRYLIHAAGAIDSQGDLVLLVGPSGVGKTTAAISLLELGWTALGDDLLFLELDARGRVSTLAHRHDFHVGDGVMQLRSGLRRFVRSRPEWEPQDKQLLQVQAAFPGRVLRRWGAPARIYFPELTDQPRSHTVPLADRDALLKLFPHSCFVGVKPDLARGHLQALRTLVDQAPAARLLCGSDLLSNPGLYSTLLEGDRCRLSASA